MMSKYSSVPGMGHITTRSMTTFYIYRHPGTANFGHTQSYYGDIWAVCTGYASTDGAKKSAVAKWEAVNWCVFNSKGVKYYVDKATLLMYEKGLPEFNSKTKKYHWVGTESEAIHEVSENNNLYSCAFLIDSYNDHLNRIAMHFPDMKNPPPPPPTPEERLRRIGELTHLHDDLTLFNAAWGHIPDISITIEDVTPAHPGQTLTDYINSII